MVLKVGTDCSGIEAPIQALKKLKINFSHEWSCEIDKYARESIKANYNPKILFEDMTKKRKLPNIDLYVCGFPCQTFSMAGDRKGFGDPRGTIFWQCLKVIRSKKPKIFILENVKGLVNHDQGNSFRTILNCLKRVKIYNIYYKVLNTRDYGIPQNRERIFLVGIRKDKQKTEFQFPKKKKMKDIRLYIDTNDKSKYPIQKCIKKYYTQSKGIFIDISWIKLTSKNAFQTYAPTICTNGHMWCKPMNRRANIKEYLKLQGFPTSFKVVVSDCQLKKQVGNSMSVNVLVELIKSILNCMKRN
jgi:DNA (cytosine-5)-methyltransferase 1